MNNVNSIKIYLYFYLFYIVIVTYSNFSSYSVYLHGLYKFIFIFAIFINIIVLFFIKDVNNNKSNWDYSIIIFSIVSLFVLSILHIHMITPSVLSIILFIANLKYINLDDFIRNDFKIKLFLMISIFFLFLLGLSPDILNFIHRDGMLQFMGGFGNHNRFAGYAFYVILSYIIFINKKAYHIRYLIFISIYLLLIFYLTDSRGFIVAGVSLILLLIISKIKFIKKFIEYLSVIFLILISMISILIPKDLTSYSSFFYYYNKLLSNRLALQHLAISSYPIKLVGHINMKWLSFYNGDNVVNIDNTYLILILSSGIIGLFIFEFILLRACVNAIKYNNCLLCIILCSLFIYFIVEDVSSEIIMYTPIICTYIINWKAKSSKERLNRFLN